jgi:hypothetical protein
MNRVTVVAPDRPGLVAELCERLAAREINVTAVDGQVIGQDAVLRLEVDDLIAAIATLIEAGCCVMPSDVVTFMVDNVPGALARVARELWDGKIDIRMMHTISRNAGQCVVAITTNDNARAKELLAGRVR